MDESFDFHARQVVDEATNPCLTFNGGTRRLVHYVSFPKASFFANHSDPIASITPEPAKPEHKSHTQRSESSFLMFTKQQSNQLERIHEGNTFGGSDWSLASTFLPGNSPYRLLT